MKKIFISYSYDCEEHEVWVKKLADDLESYMEFHVVFDKYDLDSFSDKNKFMEDAIFDSDLILVVSTNEYAKKANERTGGVGIETFMATARHWEESTSRNASNIILIKRDKGDSCIPNYLKGKMYINFSEDNVYQQACRKLIDLVSEYKNKSRPPKTKTIKKKLYNFTKAEDLLKISYKKRNQIISIDDTKIHISLEIHP